MNKVRKSVWYLAICIMVMIGCTAFAYAADDGLLPDYTGKVVVLQSNDVHGAIDGYQYMAGLRDELVKRGADVLLVDSGDFLQGSEHVSYNKGASAIALMNKTGYNIITIGNHEFDYMYDWLRDKEHEFDAQVICDDVWKENSGQAFAPTAFRTIGGVKIGFFGTLAPGTKTNTNPKNLVGINILDDHTSPTFVDQVASDVRMLRADADIVIGLTHLGVDESAAPYRSTDLWAQLAGTDAQPDLLLDGHSHTVMTHGASGEPIMSTGTKFANIGMVVINESTKSIESWDLYPVTDSSYSNAEVKEVSDRIHKVVEELYGQKVGTSDVELNGYKSAEDAKAAGASVRNGNRDGETNTGDFAADAFRWFALKDGQTYEVPEDHIISIENGGALRTKITKGDVHRKDLLSVFPFANTIVGVYVTGDQLLEALEASTQSLPAPIAGFPQVSGMKYTVDTSKAYQPREEPYPGTTVYGPKEICRVSIQSVNGKKFSKSDTYMIVTNDFVASGGDTYAVIRGSRQMQIANVDMGVIEDYLTEGLNGVIGKTYAQPDGRVTLLPKEANPMTVKVKTKGQTVKVKKLKNRSVTVQPLQVTKAKGTVTYKKLSGSKKLTLSKKTGKLTLKKGTKKGTYKVRIQVKAAGDQYYNVKTVERKVTVRVK